MTRAEARVLAEGAALELPLNDARAYRLVELPNGLSALLVSDPTIGGDSLPPTAPVPGGSCWPSRRRGSEEEAGDVNTKMAACALAVGVGYLNDPPHLGGLAHFVEHMLFMGTSKHPRENSWNRFLSKHGGSDNGETDAESTVFYFDVKHDFLRPALERFGTFFSCPLFKWDGSRREVRAIDSEFQQAQQNDACRVEQLIAHMSTPDHPYDRFGWGNKRSLVDLPKAAGTDVRAALNSFHGRFYSANIMSLVVVGKESLDTLQRWISDSFGETPNRQIERPLVPSSAPPIEPSRLPMRLTAQPLEQSRQLGLGWYLPPQISRDHVRCKPCDVVGHLVGHEGAGSILAYLKRRGLATELYAGLEEGDSTATAALFRVGVELTTAGVGAMGEVITAVLCYIGYVAAYGAPPAWTWEEVRDIAALNFQYADEEDGQSYARRLALSMLQRHPPKETLSADWLYDEYIPALATEVLQQLTPANMVVLEYVREDHAGGDAGSESAAPDSSAEGAGEFGMMCEEAIDEDEPAQEGGVAKLPVPPTPQLPVTIAGSAGLAAIVPTLRLGGKRPMWARPGGCMCTVEQPCVEHAIVPASKAAPASTAAAAPAASSADLSSYETEPWFGIRYRQESVASEDYAQWVAAYDAGRTAGLAAATRGAATAGESGTAGDKFVELASQFHLPTRNKFIPTDFALRGAAAPAAAPSELERSAKQRAGVMRPARPSPRLLVASSVGCCFFHPDERWRTPKAIYWLGLTCTRRVRQATVEECLLSALAVDLTLEALNEESYAATTAGLAYTLSCTARGYVISAAGFSHKCPDLTLRVCAALVDTIIRPIDRALFERSVAKMTLGLRNSGHTAAARARQARLQCLESPHYSPADQLAALPKLTPQMLEAYLTDEFDLSSDTGSALHVTAFACGNLDASEALKFYQSALTALRVTQSTEPLPPAAAAPPLAAAGASGVVATEPWRAVPPHVAGGLMAEGCVILPSQPARHYRVVSATNKEETNRAVELYWQLGPVSFALAAKVELLVHLMWEPIFNRLRTKEQLGYSVGCSVRNTHGVLGFAIDVTTGQASPAHVEARAMRFLRRFLPTIGRMRPATYAANVSACVSSMLRDDHSLADESDRLLAEIASRQYVFDRAEREAAAMRSVTQAELATWARSALLREGTRSLSIHAHEGAVTEPHALPAPRTPSGVVAAVALAQPEAFKAGLPIWRQADQPMPSVTPVVAERA